MMNMANYLRDKLGDETLLGTDWTPPATIYLALYTVAPDATGGGTEVTGGSYARPAITFTSSATAGEYDNDLTTIPDMPAADVVGLAILDAVTAGNFLFFESFAAVTVAAADTYVVAADTLTIAFS